VLDGEYDLARSSELRQMILLARKDEPMVIVDMADVTFIDSTALRALLETRAALMDKGATIIISNPSSIVKRVLGVVGMNELFGLEQPE
jgi:anti-anti-sigma factor